MKLFTNRKGETIMETIIALAILSVGITLSGTIIGSSLRNINAAKNRIIAVNIAREGIEAVRNVRDTNWLKFSGRRRVCWNHLPGLSSHEACDGSSPIEPGDYIVYRQNNDRWRLLPLAWPGIRIADNATIPNADASPGEFYHNTDTGRTYQSLDGEWEDISVLDLVDTDPMNDSGGDRINDNDGDIYNHTMTRDSDSMGQENQVRRSPLKRIITIDYFTNDGKLIQGDIGLNAVGNEHNRMRVTSTVTWPGSGTTIFKTELTTHLTDYLGRENMAN